VGVVVLRRVSSCLFLAAPLSVALVLAFGAVGVTGGALDASSPDQTSNPGSAAAVQASGAAGTVVVKPVKAKPAAMRVSARALAGASPATVSKALFKRTAKGTIAPVGKAAKPATRVTFAVDGKAVRSSLAVPARRTAVVSAKSPAPSSDSSAAGGAQALSSGGSTARISLAGFVSAAPAASPPFTQCPAVGLDTSCGVLLIVTDAGVTVLSDASQPPYDGVEDTLIGIVNQSTSPLSKLSLASNTDLFGFDGDGICTVTPAAPSCPATGPTGYEGPNTSFSNVTANSSGGTVNFPAPLTQGQSTYFALEEALTASQVFNGGASSAEQGGASNPSENITPCFSHDPVNCATGVLVESDTDAAVPGRGVALSLARTYVSSSAATDGPFGFGWSSSYGMSLAVDPATGAATVTQENGSQVTFLPSGSAYVAAPRVFAGLVKNSNGTFTFTRTHTGVRFDFSATGQLHTCLALDDTADLRGPLRAGASDELLFDAIRAAVAGKARGHEFTSCGGGGPRKHMVAIGG